MCHMTKSSSGGGVSGSGLGLRSVEGPAGTRRLEEGTTGPGHPPLVVLWALVLLSSDPVQVLVQVLLQDPSRLAPLDQTDRNPRHPSGGGDLQGGDVRGTKSVHSSDGL